MKRINVLNGKDMMGGTNKPREFWVEFGGDPSNDKEVYKRYSARVPFEPTDFSDEVIHCVEYSAYEKAQYEIENLKNQIDHLEYKLICVYGKIPND